MSRRSTGRVVPPEYIEQRALFQWRRLMLPTFPALRVMYAIPNAGGYRGGFRANHARVAGMLAEGVLPGMPDVHLPVEGKGALSLYIELKVMVGGRLSPAQEACHRLLEEYGNQVYVCAGWPAAAKRIGWYLTSHPEDAERILNAPDVPMPTRHRLPGHGAPCG